MSDPGTPLCDVSGSFIVRESSLVFGRFGGDLLSHGLSRSTIGAVALNGRVRDGIGCFAHAMTTKPAKNKGDTRRALLAPGLSMCSLGSMASFQCVGMGWRIRAFALTVFLSRLRALVRRFSVPRNVRSSVRRSQASSGRLRPRCHRGALLISSLLDRIKPIGQLVPVS